MPISPGSRIGHYEITSRIGAGGMGEVFRAVDSRLGRAVAIKVLPAEFAADAVRLERFEREARAASALNHPNIITVHDVGRLDGISYLTMELVEGKSLRDLVERGALPVRRLLDIGAQTAEGLAKAHEAGIIHRDLKPENIMISADGFVKILDFGLAKLTAVAASDVDDGKTAVKHVSTEGTLLGTIGYMSPEQAGGQKVDFRSDQFSLGTILYEMASGTRPFKRNTAAETLTAIIREDPPALSQLAPALPAPLRWSIERCLAKEPDDRYASTKDLARDLKSIRDHLSEVDAVRPSVTASRRSVARAAGIGTAAAIALAAAAFFVGRRAGYVPPPKFTQVTFRRGTITSARFAPNGRVMYAASWEGQRNDIFENELDNPDSRTLGITGSDILAISPSGKMLILLRRHETGPFQYTGTLAEMTVGGNGAPRELLDNVREADWTPDEKDMAIVRDVGGRSRIELPAGHVLYDTGGWISSARVSRDGSEIAFMEHAILNDDGGSVGIVDRRGHKRVLSDEFQSIGGLAWSATSDEVWFTGSKGGLNGGLWAVSRSGRQRLLANVAGNLTLHDIAANGRVAVTQDLHRVRAFVSRGGKENDFTWFDWTLPNDLSSDGRVVAFTEAGEAGGDGYSVFVRGIDGSAAVRLGDGAAQGISPDGSLVLAISPARNEIILYPTRAGQAQRLMLPGLRAQVVDWMPDGNQILVTASEPGHATRLYLTDRSGRRPTAISPDGYRQFSRCVSPDGKWVATTGPDQRRYLYPIGGGAPRLLSMLTAADFPTRWTSDSRTLYVYQRGEIPSRVDRLNVQTGEKQLWKEIQPPEYAGINDISPVIPTSDGSTYVAAYRQQLSDLFLLDGVR